MLAGVLALALVLAFAFTPCCDVGAALMPDDAAHAVSHDSVPDGNRGDHCTVWLDRSGMLPEAVVIPPVVPAIVVPYASFSPPPSPPVTAGRLFFFPGSPSDALYLRYARLIL